MSLKYQFIFKRSYNVKTRTDAFEFHVQYKVMKLQLSIQKNYKIFYFQVFPKDRVVFRTHSNI